jgi:FG-GAP-like repeat
MTFFKHLLGLCALHSSAPVLAMALMAQADSSQCASGFAQSKQSMEQQQKAAPATAAKRLPQSQATSGQRDIAWAWLASPTARYPHSSMGSPVHAASLHVIGRDGKLASLQLPSQRVFEDLQPRLVDLDGDGRDEIIVIEADIERGAALVAYGLPTSGNKLEERARSSYLGLPFRWLNPVGFADFDGDGKLDIASITTPHIGGTLTLYRYAPPRIEPFAKAMDVSNHQMGDPNLQMHAILSLPGQRPTVVVPDMSRRALHALRWEMMDGKAQWKELADVKPLPGRVNYLMPLTASSACAQLADGSWWRIELMQ